MGWGGGGVCVKVGTAEGTGRMPRMSYRFLPGEDSEGEMVPRCLSTKCWYHLYI